MGSASSKATGRKLARAPPAWAGARTPNPSEIPHPHSRPVPRASEIKDEAIELDSKDPQLLANLSKLGPVTVDHHMQTIRPDAASAQQLFQSRLRSEEEARSSRPTPNRLIASSLDELLERRKQAVTQQELTDLARKYGMDPEKLQTLARSVNSVSVNPGSVRRTVGEDGSENVTMLASWVEPKLQADMPALEAGR